MGFLRRWLQPDETPDPAWKPTGYRYTTPRDYDYDGAKRYQAEKLSRAELTRQLAEKLSQPAEPDHRVLTMRKKAR